MRARRSAGALRDPAAWTLSIHLFRARTGTASALELIEREDGGLRISAGPHPNCASLPVPAPKGLAALQRIVVQPRKWQSCLAWWTVDAFVGADGKIRAVTFDLWEP